MREKMTERTRSAEIKIPPSKMGEVLEDLVHQVSQLNIIPVSLQKKIVCEIEPKRWNELEDSDVSQTSHLKKSNFAIEKKTNNIEKEERNQTGSTCTDVPKTKEDINRNVINPNSTSIDDILVQTNNLSLECESGGSDDEENYSDASDDEENDSDEATMRGPYTSRKSYSHTGTPYSRPDTSDSVPENALRIPSQENIYNLDIFPKFFSENAINDSSHLLYSGGNVLSSEQETIKNLKEFLESPEILESPNNISFDDLLDFDYISSRDDDELRNEIENYIVDNLDPSNEIPRPDSIGSFSSVSSPPSSEADQVVSSPGMCYPEQWPTSPFYISIENIASPEMSQTSNESFTCNDVIVNVNGKSPKEIKILPKSIISNENSGLKISNKTNRSTGPRNVYLSTINKKTKDSYHKLILKLSDEKLDKIDKDGRNFLQCAILAQRPEFAAYFAHLMKLWIKKSPKPKGLENIQSIGTFVNHQDKEGRTALYLSTLYNQSNVSGFLFDDCNADIQIPDKQGETPLHIVCQKGERYLSILEIFTKDPGKINLQLTNSWKRTPLHEAVNYHSKLSALEDETPEIINNLPIVKRLLSSGARIDVVDKYGYTPIHLAVKNMRVDILEELYAHGSCCGFDKAINIKDNDSKTVLDLACSMDYSENITMIEKLLSYEALPGVP